MARTKCQHCESVQIYTRNDGQKVCRKCGEVQKKRKAEK